MGDQSNKDAATKGILKPGLKAPDFTLPATPDQNVSLHNFRGKPVILAFYPADWSPVCGDELALFNQVLPEFQKYGAELIGISVDGVWSHLAYAKEKNLHFPILADFHPKGKIGSKYGAYNPGKGREDRALFVINPEGVIYWSYLSPSGINPGAEGILSALDEMQSQAAKEESHGKAGSTR